jgi:predicted permease
MGMLSDGMLRLRALFRRTTVEREIDDELRFHVDRQVDTYVARGMTREEAIRRVRIEFGGLDQVKAEYRDALGVRLVDNLARDLRLALRQFRTHPIFTLVTVLVLGLGTGAATAVFTIVDSVVLRPLPYSQPDRLVTLTDVNPQQGPAHNPISPVSFMEFRALPVFRDAAGWWRPSVNLVDPGLDPVRVNAVAASGNLFEVLGVNPQVGPGFPAREFFSREPIVVISDRLWRARYSADPSIIGRQLRFNGEAHTIAGVMPGTFHFPDDIDVWQRLRTDFATSVRGARYVEAVARLADGTTLEQAQSASDALSQRLEDEFPQSNRGWETRLVPLLEEQLGYYRPALMVLFGAVGLLLVIACLNVASLLLTRAVAREREIAVRAALGASLRQLVTQLLTESAVVSAAGAIVGLAAAAVALPMIVRLAPVDIPRLAEASLDIRALGLGVAFVCATTVLFSLLPALTLLRSRLTHSLRSGDRGNSRAPQRLYSILVTAEVALACALLVSSVLLVRTVAQMSRAPIGVDADDTVFASVQLTNTAYDTWTTVADVHSAIIERIRQQPGVDTVGGSNHVPLEIGSREPFAVEGEPPPARPEDARLAQYHSVSEGFFEAMGVPLVAGRAFTPFDGIGSAPVVIVNETFARQFLASGPATGRVLVSYTTRVGPIGANLFSPPPVPAGTSARPPAMRFEVVGVVPDVRNAPLGQAVEPAIYFSTRQFPFRKQFVAVRARDRATAVAGIKNGIAAIAPDLPSSGVNTWGEHLALLTAEPRLLMTILLFFGGLAALLAALGVYGLFSWSVAQRTRELAIRLTLGARPTAVAGSVIWQSLMLVMAGLAVGLLLVRVGHGALQRVLFEVSPGDLGSTAAAAVLILLAAAVACVPPTLRAMRVDPVRGLRME